MGKHGFAENFRNSSSLPPSSLSLRACQELLKFWSSIGVGYTQPCRKIKSDGRTEMWMEDGQGSRTPASLSSLVQPNVTIAET